MPNHSNVPPIGAARISRHAGVRACMMAMISILPLACRNSPHQPDPAAMEQAITEIASDYVRLALGVGEHEEGYIDAYFGPESWREDVRRSVPSLDSLHRAAETIITRLADVGADTDTRMAARVGYLSKQLHAVRSRIAMLQGERLGFDAEAQALYDALPPHYSEAHFDSLLAQLDQQLPGVGSVTQRLERYRERFVIPAERLDTVFAAAIEEARARTRRRLVLPDHERFTLEFVTDKSWSGYNWYQGGAASLIQVNTDLPITIDRAIDLAAHEGYPGHHVYNLLLEQHLARDRGWPEYLIYVLFSPQSLLAEGTANFGVDVAFPADERLEFEREVLFPLAGLDPSGADGYAAVRVLADRLSYAGNEAARRYLDGSIDANSAVAYLSRYALMSPERAQQRLRFIDAYRAYVINYNLGQDLVRAYVERLGGTADDPDRRWEIFGRLLASPQTPSGLR